MWGLFARLYGTNNLPDSSNMCHESTSVALPETIGVSVGTVTLDDFEQTDGIFFFGQNVGTNSPRMLHPLQEASKRGVPISIDVRSCGANVSMPGRVLIYGGTGGIGAATARLLRARGHSLHLSGATRAGSLP